MKYFTFVGTLAVCAASAKATDWQVAAGLQGATGAVYAPDSLNVKPGDTISFLLVGVVPVLYWRN
jgi:plastocyanin